MVNIFKSLNRTYYQAICALNAAQKGSQEESECKDVVELLEELIDYMKSYKWLHKGPSKEKIKVWLESGYDYDVLCKTFNISYDCAKSTVSWANSQFKKKIGENTIKLIKEGHIREARAAFYVGADLLTLNMLIGSDYLDALPSPKFDIFSLDDCKEELEILGLISKVRLEKYLETMDKDKMAYLLWLLVGKSKKSDVYRPHLLLLLADRIDVDTLVNMEDEIKSQQNVV